MECKMRDWKIEDAPLLAAALNNKNIQNNLRDGLPYPYTESDAKDYISGVLSADKTGTFAFAIMFLATPTSSAFLQSRLPTTSALAGYLKKMDFSMRVRFAATLLKTVWSLI